VHLLNDLPLRLHRESDDGGLWEHRLDMPRRPNAIYLRHIDIHLLSGYIYTASITSIPLPASPTTFI
jgi:hypothetical protein